MKMKLFTSIAAFAMITLSACEKEEIETSPLASLQVVNAVIGGEELKLGTNVATIAGNSATAFGMLAGKRQLKLETGTVPSVPYYDQNQDFVNGGVYSLFLGGTPDVVDPLFLKEENIPSHDTDVFGARVINLSPGSDPISVNLVETSNGSFVSSLDYKTVSAFNEVSSIAAEGDKVFEFRNAKSGALITSFTVPGYDLPRFRNITLVYTGAVGAELVFRVNNY